MNINDPISFTEDELLYLQNLLDAERAGWFNFYMETLSEERPGGAESAHEKYLISKALRNKFYHLGGRDTLAPNDGGYHEQRQDQGHDW